MPRESIDMTPKRARELGEFVRSERTVTQPELARVGGFSKEWLSRLESGAGNPSVLYLGNLSEALGFDRGALARYASGGPKPKKLPADPDALRDGHGGTEGWPPWLEAKFRRLERRVDELERVADRWGSSPCLQPIHDPVEACDDRGATRTSINSRRDRSAPKTSPIRLPHFLTNA